MSLKRVKCDIDALKQITAPVRKLVNKAFTHTEWDRRKHGKLKYEQLNIAVETLALTYARYHELIVGSCPDPIVPLDTYDVLSDLEKIWPKEAERPSRKAAK